MIALHVLRVALNIYVLAVISCGTDHQLQSAMIITGKASVENTEWVSSACHSNLSDEKLPVYFKANKMNFLVKPECLNFTPLQEILKSLCIPFIQIIL